MAMVHPENAALSSSLSIDRIIGTFTATLSVGVNTTASTSIPHGFGEMVFFRGVISLDGGTTWQDLNYVGLDGSSFRFVSFLSCRADRFDWSISSFGGTSYSNVQLKLYAIQRGDQTLINTTPSNNTTAFSSQYNYQKIAFDHVVPFTIGSEIKTFTFHHGLGYAPKVMGFFYMDTNGHLTDMVGYDTARAPIVGTSTVSYTIDNTGGAAASGTLYMRIYYDA